MSKLASDPYATFSMPWRNASAWVWRVMGRIWFRVRVEGLDHMPSDGPVLVVANHCSFLDPPLCGAFAVRPLHFLARETLQKIPLMGPWMRRMGVVLLPRNATPKDALRTVLLGLEKGRVVCMFPEGTRSEDGKVGPFRGGVEFLARKTGAKILPVGLNGTGRALPKGAWFARPRKCIVRWGEPWTAEQILEPGGVDALRARVAELADMPLRESDGGSDASIQHTSSPRPTASSVEGGSSGAGAAPGSTDGPSTVLDRVQNTPAERSLGVTQPTVSQQRFP